MPDYRKPKKGLVSSLSLSQKGLFLLAVPVVVQISLMACLVFLQGKAEEEAEKAERARKVTDLINVLFKESYAIVKLGFQVISAQASDETAPLLFENMDNQFKQLKQMVKHDPEDKKIVDTAFDSYMKGKNLIDYAKGAVQRGELRQGSELKFECLRRFRKFANGMIPLVSMEQSKKILLDKSPLRQERVRNAVKNVVIGSTFLNLVFLLALGRFFSQSIARGLTIMIDNSNRLAADKPLNPLLPGQDEIAQLDYAFHNMAEELQEASRKQRSLIENARDVICSLNREGSFIAVSSASSTVFGRSPDSLVTTNMIELVVPEDRKNTLEELQLILAGNERPPFETRMIKPDGTWIDILWSVIWSKSEGIMFCVAHNITERKAAERLRQEVVQMVSHDLRSPLSVMESFHGMLEAGILGQLNPKGQELLRLANRTTSRMLTLVNDLLDIEKVESGRLRLEMRQVVLSSVLEQAIQSVQSQADKAGVNLELVNTDATVYGDQYRIVQVLVNLLSNAIKFSEPQTNVTLNACSKEDRVEIRVIDQGRGIPANLHDSIFERFKQVELTDGSVKGGAGLGLAICKALVELHGGQIWVESEVGQGSTFVVSLRREGESSVHMSSNPLLSNSAEAKSPSSNSAVSDSPSSKPASSSASSAAAPTAPVESTAAAEPKAKSAVPESETVPSSSISEKDSADDGASQSNSLDLRAQESSA